MRKKALGSQEIGLNGVRNYRPSMFSLSSPLPLGSSVSNQLKLLKALGFCHILGGKSCPMPDRSLGPAPEPRGPERGEKPLCLCSRHPFPTAAVPDRPPSHHRPEEDFLLLLPEAQAQGDQLLPGRRGHCAPALAPPGHVSRNLWIF